MIVDNLASEPHRATRRRNRARSWWTGLGILSITIGFSAVVVTASLRTTAELSSRTANPYVNTAYFQERCLTRLMRTDLPQGAKVYVLPNPNGYEVQLLTQYMTLWAVPTPLLHDAQWTVALVSHPGGCDGDTLQVKHF